MPVTLITAEHPPPREWEAKKVSTAEELFRLSCPQDYRCSQKLVQSSFPQSLFRTSHVSASQHGFVWAVFNAYSCHHNLTIRPEDVWFSILTQIGFFVKAHAEELRSFFVSHEGQKELEIAVNQSMDTVNFGALALQMTNLIEENVVDEELRAWIMPDFSTTTQSDNVVAAILMMGTLQKYFKYTCRLLCGIPSVTLAGEREDWVTLVKKLEKLHQLGDEPARFAQLLRPVLNHFVASFDSPNSLDVLNFWSRCADQRSAGSGPSDLSGWITVFCFWDEYGKLLCREPIHRTSSLEFEACNTEMLLGDALSRRVNTDDVPSGFASVPVTVDNNGIIYDTVMLAGLIGIQATSNEAMEDGDRGCKNGSRVGYEDNGQRQPIVEARFDSIQPLSGWWMY